MPASPSWRDWGVDRRSAMASVAAIGLSLLGSSLPAHAAPIPLDLAISGSIELDTGFSFDAGSASASGVIDLTVGGTTTTTTYSGGTASGANPLTGTFTDTGDGLGLSGSADGTAVDDEFATGIDFVVDLANLSLTDVYEVVFTIDFDHRADADGDDAYVESEFTLDQDFVEVFFTEILSDTAFGDELNGASLGTFGALVTDAGTDSLTVNLAPGASALLEGAFTMEGGVFDPGSALGIFDFGLTIAEINNVTAPPTPTPEPGTMLLLGSGFAALLWGRRRAAGASA